MAYPILNSVCILLLVSSGSPFLFDDASNLQNLLQLITDEKQMRASLEYEIQSLKKDINDMKARHKSRKYVFHTEGETIFSYLVEKFKRKTRPLN